MNPLRPSMVRGTIRYVNEHREKFGGERSECILLALGKQQPAEITITDDKMKCPKCGDSRLTVERMTHKYCPNCGQKLKICPK